MPSLYDFSAKTLSGQDVALSDYRGRVLLIVNTASKCGFTPQYKELEELQRRLSPRGLTVLGFPCNQFGQQEPLSEGEINEFCTINYGVTFSMFAKIDVNGADAHPLYKFLTREKRGILGTARIKWNFTKFLADRAGKIVKRFGPATKPSKIEPAMAALL